MTSTSFAGRNILVTGASRGIGKSIAEGFVSAGASLAITGRKLDSIQSAAAELDPSGAILAQVCNQGDPAHIGSLFTELDSHWDQIDVVVINAATNPVMSNMVDLDVDAWNKIIQVNLTGAFLTAQAAARRMRNHSNGSIIFVSSVAAYEPMPGLGAYSVSKSALNTLTQVFAKELGSDGVRVNGVAPGLIETQFSERLIGHKPTYEHIVNKTALRRHGQPSEIVGTIMHLASESSSFMTGQIITIDGGMVMR